jgi:mRNA interferase RelE/StbE
VSEEPWDLRVMAPARRQLDRLPISVTSAVLETLGAIAVNPHRLGEPLRFELEGTWSARRGPYRVIYRIDEATRTVAVLAVAHRADVYRPNR